MTNQQAIELHDRFLEVKDCIAWYVKRKYKHADIEDMVQEAFIFVWTHLDQWNPEKGELTTFATNGARMACSVFLRRQKPTVQFPDKFDVMESTDTVEDAVETVRQLLLHLHGNHKRVVEMRLKGYTFGKIAEVAGMTRQRWEQLFVEAVRAMQKV